MTTDRAKREGEIARTVWAVTLALVVGSFGFVVFAGGPSADEADLALVEAAPMPLAAVAAPLAPSAVRVAVAPAVVSLAPEKQASRPAVAAAPKAAASKPAAPKPAAPAPRQGAPVPGVSPAPAPAPRRVVVVRRSRAS